jgi:uncharacterized protein
MAGRVRSFAMPDGVAALAAERAAAPTGVARRTARTTAQASRLPSQPVPAHDDAWRRAASHLDVLRAVLDTNVSVGACFAPASASAHILQRWRTGRFGLVMSAPLRGELADLARRLGAIRAVRRPASCLAELLEELDARADWVEPAPLEITLSDPADELVLGTAVAGRAAYLVSNDAVLLAADGYRAIRILRPGRFLDLLEPQPPANPPDPAGQDPSRPAPPVVSP